MKKPKQPAPAHPEERDEFLADKLVDLALDLRGIELYATLPEPMKKQQSEARKLINKCLQQKRERVFDEALERTLEEDPAAHRALRAQLEELSGTLVQRRDDGPDLEVNAFVIPMFVHTTGGLREDECFQDDAAFDALRDSIQEGGLESRRASVVLVAHAYHPDELERIGFAALSEMVREALEAMTRKKGTAAQAIAASMRGWPPHAFAPEDNAVELRFLLGFALKTLDDPFYQIPEKEAAADRYFSQRAERFRAWSQCHADVLQRCLVAPGREAQIDCLYQDLFHGGLATGLNEYAMLDVLAELRRQLEAQGVEAAALKAIVGPTEADDGAILRVSLVTADEAQVAAADKPVVLGDDVRAAAEEVCDALDALGVRAFGIAREFDTDGNPVGVRPYTPR
ncbi:DUF2863 family protein [Oxalobacteraceae bacterium OM1]|nr:DUF2863 family protein [Oxalobacteraceae bacterium OM1]